MPVIICLPFSVVGVYKYLSGSDAIEGVASQGGDFFNASDDNEGWACLETSEANDAEDVGVALVDRRVLC